MLEQSSPCQQIITIALEYKIRWLKDHPKSATGQESSDIGSKSQTQMCCHMVAKFFPEQKMTKV